jgi:predicted phage-related endonuclease
VSPTHPWARVNVDRHVVGADGFSGPLEIKTVGHYPFAKVKREGMKPAHVLQLQHAIWLSGADRGAFAVLNPESWELLTFDVMRDDALIELIKIRGELFWPLITDQQTAVVPAKPYEPGDAPCKACPWRRTCHGAEAALLAGLDPEEQREALPRDEAFTEILDDYQTAAAAADDANRLVELIKGAIRDRLGEREAIECSSGRIYFRPVVRNTIDTKALRSAYPEIAQELTRQTPVRPLRVYGGKGRGGD